LDEAADVFEELVPLERGLYPSVSCSAVGTRTSKATRTAADNEALSGCDLTRGMPVDQGEGRIKRTTDQTKTPAVAPE
jgi:hypothetical protein